MFSGAQAWPGRGKEPQWACALAFLLCHKTDRVWLSHCGHRHLGGQIYTGPCVTGAALRRCELGVGSGQSGRGQAGTQRGKQELKPWLQRATREALGFCVVGSSAWSLGRGGEPGQVTGGSASWEYSQKRGGARARSPWLLPDSGSCPHRSPRPGPPSTLPSPWWWPSTLAPPPVAMLSASPVILKPST